MVGNFRGVLISLFSWLTWHFPPTKINAYGDMVLCESMTMGMATKSWQRDQYFPSNSSHCHPADSVFDSSISCYLSKSLYMYFGLISNKEDRERDRTHVSITSSLVQCHAPGLVAVMKFKTMKILRAFWTFHKNYPPYGIKLKIHTGC